jgi:heme-degrading monooxygenase HmoA
MYGTIARMRVKPGAEQALQELSRDFDAEQVPGSIGDYVLRTDADPDEYYLVALFDSKEAYATNAGSPEQHQRYLRMRELLQSDPEWHDGEVVHATASR